MPLTLEEIARSAAPTATGDAAPPSGDDPQDAGAAPVADDGAATGGDATTTEGAADTAGEGETQVTLRDIILEAKPELAGFVQKYTDDESFVEGLGNLVHKIGERDEAAGMMQWMQEQGITPDDLLGVASQKKGGGQPAAAKDAEWNDAWVSVDSKGNWQPTADAPPDFDAKLAKRRAQISKALMKGGKDLLGLLGTDLDSLIEQKAEEKVAAVRQEQRAQAEAAAIGTWAAAKRDVLYDDNGNMNAVGRAVNAILGSGKISDALPVSERLDIALDIARARTQAAPPPRKIPATARRVAPVAGGPKPKISDEEFFKKYGSDLKAFATYVNTGKLPEEA
jgi:hypothetical protein